jgi:FkbM family methyltransferase
VLNEYDNLEVFNCGLGDTAKTLTIEQVNYNDSWDYGILSLVDQEKIRSKPHDTVEIHPLDYFELDRLDFIKIDVEGMELEVLEGGRNTIEKCRPWAYIEFWNVDTAKLKSWFDSKDYTIYQFDGGNILCCPNEKLAQSNLTFNLKKW